MAKLKETTVRENLYVKGDIYVYDFTAEEYVKILAPATENTLGMIMVGDNLTIDARGVLNSVLQPVDNEFSLLSANPVENKVVYAALNTKVDKSVASSAASETNKLIDRESVESLISTNNSVFRGSFDTWAAVPLETTGYEPDETGSKIPKKNDYLIVNDASDYNEGGVSGKLGTWRFIYTTSWAVGGKGGWKPQYKISDTFDAKQKAALNSGITAAKVENYDGYAALINNKSDVGHTHPAVQIDGLKPIATSGEYKDLYNVPTAGNSANPIYFGTDPTTKTGRPYPCSFNITAAGASNKPVYLKTDTDGIVRSYACGFTIDKSIPSNAIFTDQNVLTVNSTGTFYLAGKTTTANDINSMLVNSNVYVSNGKLYASEFVGPVSGSIAWSNVTGKPSTYPPSSHSHSYLPLAGGTVTGLTTFSSTVNGSKFIVGETTTSSSSSSITLSSGHIQTCSSSYIYLPTPSASTNGITLTIICTASSVTWSNNIKWRDGKAPTFTPYVNNMVTFIGANNTWYGNYNGAFS